MAASKLGWSLSSLLSPTCPNSPLPPVRNGTITHTPSTRLHPHFMRATLAHIILGGILSAAATLRTEGPQVQFVRLC